MSESEDANLNTLPVQNNEEVKNPLDKENDSHTLIHKKSRLPKKKVIRLILCLIIIATLTLLGWIFYQRQKALTESNSFFNSAQGDLTLSGYSNAKSNLLKVISIDPHYSQAQEQLAILNDIDNIQRIINQTNNDLSKFDSAMNQFSDDFESTRVPFNVAMNYYSPGAQSSLNQADLSFKNLSNSSKNLTDIISSISNDLGSISSNKNLSSYSNTSQILASFQGISNNLDTICNSFSNGIEALKGNKTPFSYVDQGNNAMNSLHTNINNAEQGMSALKGYISGKENELLLEASRIK